MWKRNWEFFLRCFSLELATDYLTVAMNWGQFSEIFRIANFAFCEMRIKYTIIVWCLVCSVYPFQKNLLEEKDQIFGFKVVF